MIGCGPTRTCFDLHIFNVCYGWSCNEDPDSKTKILQGMNDHPDGTDGSQNK
ncbi:unnamed protein product [Amoebophrya sp. A25]|nr:unnamed protein product [Amoebophrya sp. A25]|eukprot:GSA25T00025203001.1